MEASVSTRVVSWKDAAEIERVGGERSLRDAEEQRASVARLAPSLITRSFSSRKRTCPVAAPAVNVVSRRPDFTSASSADNHFDVLVRDVDALQAGRKLPGFRSPGKTGVPFRPRHGQKFVAGLSGPSMSVRPP